MAQVEARGVWDAEVVGSSPITPTGLSLGRLAGGRSPAWQSNCLRWRQVEPSSSMVSRAREGLFVLTVRPTLPEPHPTPLRLHREASSLNRKPATCTPFDYYPLNLHTLAISP